MGKLQRMLIGFFLSGVALGGVGTGIALVEFSHLSYDGRKMAGADCLVTKELDFDFPMEGKSLILGRSYQEQINRRTKLVEDETVPAGVVRYEVTYNERAIEPYLGYEEYEEEAEGRWPGEESQEEPFGEGQPEGEPPEAGQEMEAAAEAGQEPETAAEAGQEMEAAAEAGQEMETAAEAGQGPEVTPKAGRETESGGRKEPVYAGMLRLRAVYVGDDFELFMENKDRILKELKKNKISSYEVVYVTAVTIRVNPETMPYIKADFSSN